MDAQRSINPLPGVPLIDSPFFEQGSRHFDPETRRMAVDLRDRGYTVFKFPDDEFDRLAEDVKRRHTPTPQQFEAWRANTIDLRNQDAWRTDPNVRRIATNKTLLERLHQLYGRPAFAFQTLNFAVGTQQPAHSDAMHFSSMPDGFMCGVWVALEDIDLENGPLIYFPGSHRWPHYANEQIGVNGWHQSGKEIHAAYQRVWDDLVSIHQAQPERFVARKGEAILWHARLLHGGDIQADPMRTRFSQVTHYYFHDCAYYTPQRSDPFYGNTHFREVTDVATGQPVPNSVNGHRVPFWHLSQAIYRGPLGMIRLPLSWMKRRMRRPAA